MKMKKLFSIALSTVILATCCSGLWSVSGLAPEDEASNGSGWYACHVVGSETPPLNENSDGSVNVSGNSGTALTSDTYDITKYDIKFKINSYGNWIAFTVAAVDSVENFESGVGNSTASDRLDFIVYPSDKTLRVIQATSGGGLAVMQPKYNHAVLTDGEHTFGMRKINGKWYPAIDGYTYDLAPNQTDLGRPNDRLKTWNTTAIRFGFAVNGGASADVSVVESLDFVKHSGSGTVTKQESGYALSGKADFLTDDAYDITKTDITFTINQADPNFRLTLAKNDVSNNISVPTELDILSDTNKTRLDFIAENNGNNLYIREIKFDENHNIQHNSFAIYSAVGTWSDKTTYTFGLRKDGAHWYPAVNGKIIKANANNGESLRLDDFINTNGTVLRFGIGGRKDTFKAVDVKLTYNGTYSAENLVTLCTYLLGVNNEIDKIVYDCNNDGIMDIRDLVAIKKAIAK